MKTKTEGGKNLDAVPLRSNLCMSNARDEAFKDWNLKKGQLTSGLYEK